MTTDRQHAMRLRQSERQTEIDAAVDDLSQCLEVGCSITCTNCAVSLFFVAAYRDTGAQRFYSLGWRVKEGKAICDECSSKEPAL